MVSVFPPSTVRHPWAVTLAVVVVALLAVAALAAALNGLGWLAEHVGSWEWSTVPVQA